MDSKQQQHYILGLDLGANSVGWALLKAAPVGKEEQLKINGIERAGVRVFDAGAEGDIESGRDESRGVERRNARGIRRRLDRNSRRLTRLFYLLQSAGLLPKGDASAVPARPGKAWENSSQRQKIRDAQAQERNKIIAELDKQLLIKYAKGDPQAAKKLPYLLRATSLDKKLDPYELGRALYHLGQRRGFLSNRKANSKKDEEFGEVRTKIEELAGKIEGSARTLGEYFSKLDPEQERIRSRWTSREMYDHEFETIWNAQAKNHSAILTGELKKQIYKTIFFQRPLKIQKFLVGNCPYETDKQGKPRKRAPWALLAAQRFRMLQQVNNSYIISPDGEVLEFTPEQRATLLDKLEKKDEITFKSAKKPLGLTKEFQFNFEKDGKGEFWGNSTAVELREIFGEERWNNFSESDKNKIVDELISIQSEKGLARRGKEVWGLSEEKAKKFSEVSLEDGYCGLSRQALAKLLPLMEKGVKYMAAVKEIYPDRHAGEKRDCLPSVQEIMSDLKNPVVKRVLTELRKVVNGIVKEYGKPAEIRIELAREMKKSRKDRKAIFDKNQKHRKAREEAAKQIIKEAGIEEPKRADIEKYQLWEESNHACPYTGKQINIKKLFGGEVDVEHIIPFSQCLDNSFFNKTICWHEENRNVKKNHTPFEAYAQDPEKYAEILQRVKDFQGEVRMEKLRRFKMEDLMDFDNFTSRQLNDTKYASKEAKKYIGLLYGEESLSRVQASKGGITAYVRDVWNLNKILGDGGEKNREDHRHHAVDAVAIALTDRSAVKALSSAAARAEKELSPKKFDRNKVEKFWPNFWEDVKNSIMAINVSHRVSKKVNGPMHQETFYSPPKKDQDGKSFCCVRKPVSSLTKEYLANIMDPNIKKIVMKKLEELGGDVKKFNEPKNHPFMKAKDGRKIPIHKVRVKKIMSPITVGGEGRERYVTSETNHHLEIVEVKDKKGNTKWEGHIVSQYEAMQRLRAGEPVVKRDYPGEKFVYSLADKECVLMKAVEGDNGKYSIKNVDGKSIIAEDAKGDMLIYRNSGISKNSKGQITIEFIRNADARPSSELRKIKGGRIFKTPSSLDESGARKVLLNPLGDIRWAND